MAEISDKTKAALSIPLRQAAVNYDSNINLGQAKYKLKLKEPYYSDLCNAVEVEKFSYSKIKEYTFMVLGLQINTEKLELTGMVGAFKDG